MDESCQGCLSPFTVSGMAIFTTACPQKHLKSSTGRKENILHGTGVERGQVRRSTQHRSHPGLPQAHVFGMLAHISDHHIVIGSQDRSKIHSCGKQIIPDLQKQCCERRARRSVGQMCQRGSQCPERGTTPMLPMQLFGCSLHHS